MRPTPGRGRRRRRLRRGVAGRCSSRCSAAGWCSPPTSTTCWPAGRSRRPTPTRASRCTRTASAWPAPSSSSSPVEADEVTGVAPASSPGPTPTPPRRRLPRYERLPRQSAPSLGCRHACGPAAQRAGRRPHRHLRRRRARAARCAPRRDDVRVVPGREPASSAATSASPGCWWGRTWPRSWPTSPRATATCCPTCACRRAASSTAPAPRTCPARSRSSPPTVEPLLRRPRGVSVDKPCPGCPSSPSSAVPTSASRPSLNRIVGQPRGDRRGEARRHARPQGGRRRVAAACSFRSSTPAGGCPAATRLDAKVSQQAEQAMAEADAVLFVVDAAIGVTEEDARVAEAALRRSGRGCCSSPTRSTTTTGKPPSGSPARPRRRRAPYPVSRPARPRHRATSLDELDRRLSRPEEARAARSVDEAGRATPRPGLSPWRSSAGPTSGKSTLFNRLIGEDRAVVHDMPGTTRDTIDTVVETEDGPIVFVDTAGMRRQAKIDEGTEYYSLVRALQAVDHGRRRPARDRRHRGRDRPGPAARRAGRRRRLPARRAAQQVGAARRRGRADVTQPGGAEAPLHRRGAGAEDVGAHRQGRAQAAAGAGVDASRPTTARVPTRQVNEVIRVGPGPPARRPTAPGALRHAGRHRPADVHAVRQPGAAPHLPALPGEPAPRGVRPRCRSA